MPRAKDNRLREEGTGVDMVIDESDYDWSSEGSSDEWNDEESDYDTGSEDEDEGSYYYQDEDDPRHPSGQRRVRYFRHKPLDYPHEDIRLVRVLPYHNNTVQCELVRMTRKRAFRIRYRALSYEWNLRKGERRIEVNSLPHKVPENLYDFLKHAAVNRRRHVASWTCGYYWIDNLCIDQSKTGRPEKQIQMLYMRRIYRGAFETIAWLGGDLPQMTDAVQDLGKFHDKIQARGRGSSQRAIHEWSVKSLNDPQAIEVKHMRAVKTILTSSYWRRIWILQEIAVADQQRKCGRDGDGRERVRLVCGTAECPWSFFVVLPAVIQTHPGQTELVMSLKESLSKTQGVWLLFCMSTRVSVAPGRFSYTQLSLPLLIYLTENSKATRSVDHIWALLGLVKKGFGRRMKPDLSLTGCEIICQVMATILERRRIRTHPGAKAKYRRLKKIAQEAKHDPLDYSTKMARERQACCGKSCTTRKCKSEVPDCNCDCDSLKTCRAMATELYGEVDVLKFFFGSGWKSETVVFTRDGASTEHHVQRMVLKALLQGVASGINILANQ